MIYFRCDVSQTIGWGHLKRCIALAGGLNSITKCCFLMVDPDEYITQLIHQSGATIHALPRDLSYAQEIEHYPTNAQNIIIDLGHRKNLERPNAFIEYLGALDDQKYQIAIMDGLDADSFRDERTPKTKAYIQPYWDVEEKKPPHTQHWIYGAPFVLLDQIYKNAFRDRTNAELRNILVTFGGSDPQNNTYKVMRALCHKQFDQYQIRLIIGPSFADHQTKQIESLAQNQDNITLIYAPKALRNHYDWADLCVGASSISRYEAAACGLPMIFAAIYPEHIQFSQRFATYETAHYAGYADELTQEHWHETLLSLLQTSEPYIKMVSALKAMRQHQFGTDQLAKTLMDIFETTKDKL